MTSLATKLRMRVGATYRVGGILHDYLGPAISPETGRLVHAFRRREWRPDTPDQLLVTLVAECEIQRAVTIWPA